MQRPFQHMIYCLVLLTGIGFSAVSRAALMDFYPLSVTSDSGVVVTLQVPDGPIAPGHSPQFRVMFSQAIVPTKITFGLPRFDRVTLSHQYTQGDQPAVTALTLPPAPVDEAGVWQLILTYDTGNLETVALQLAIDESTSSTQIETDPPVWTDAEVVLLQIMRLPDKEKRYTTEHYTDPESAAQLGHLLFFDKNISGNSSVACATCHQPEQHFTDGLPTAAGLAPLKRNSPTLLGIGGFRWFNLDGSADSLWSQTLGPIENAAELGTTRTALLKFITANAKLLALYNNAFATPLSRTWVASLPDHASPRGNKADSDLWRTLDDQTKALVDRHFVNVGRAFAAYVQQLDLEDARFDRYVDAVAIGDQETAQELFSKSELAGLKLFVSSRTACLSCHSGPLFSNQKFHNIGTATTDRGRESAIETLVDSPFNCAGEHGASPGACSKLDNLDAAEISYLIDGAFRTPTLRNVGKTAPYMHDGSLTTLSDVMLHYRNPPEPAANGTVTHELIARPGLTDAELEELAAFLRTLTSPVPSSSWYHPPKTTDKR